MPDLRQSSQYTKYLRITGWIVEKVDGAYVFVRQLPLTPFSIIKIQRPRIIPDLEKIDKLAKKYRAISTTIEPSAVSNQSSVARLKKTGYRLSKSPYLPTKTIQIDLTQSEKLILQQMKKDARCLIRKTQKSDDYETSIYRNLEEIKIFWQAWKKIAGWKKIIPSLKSTHALKKTFGQNCLFLALNFSNHSNDRRISEKILAGTIILITNKTAYYYYAFTSKKGRQHLAQYRLIWEAIKKTKSMDCRVFDFEGIDDPRFPNKSWAGFSHFKKSFGGKEIDYPGCFKRKA